MRVILIKTVMFFIVTVVLTTSACLPVYGQTEDVWRFAASTSLGMNFTDLTGAFTDAGVKLSDDFLWSWGVEYHFYENWSAEVRWSGSWGKADIMNGAVEADVDPMYFNGNVIYYVPVHSYIEPFIAAGAGIAVLDIDRDELRVSEKFFALNVGGGLLIPVHKYIAIRGEIRGYIYNVNDLSDTAVEALRVPPDFSRTVSDLHLSAGVSFTF